MAPTWTARPWSPAPDSTWWHLPRCRRWGWGWRWCVAGPTTAARPSPLGWSEGSTDPRCRERGRWARGRCPPPRRAPPSRRTRSPGQAPCAPSWTDPFAAAAAANRRRTAAARGDRGAVRGSSGRSAAAGRWDASCGAPCPRPGRTAPVARPAWPAAGAAVRRDSAATVPAARTRDSAAGATRARTPTTAAAAAGVRSWTLPIRLPARR